VSYEYGIFVHYVKYWPSVLYVKFIVKSSTTEAWSTRSLAKRLIAQPALMASCKRQFLKHLEHFQLRSKPDYDCQEWPVYLNVVRTWHCQVLVANDISCRTAVVGWRAFKTRLLRRSRMGIQPCSQAEAKDFLMLSCHYIGHVLVTYVYICVTNY